MEHLRITYFKLKKTSDAASKVLEAMAALMIIMCVATLFFQVLYRFIIIKFFSFSFPFTEEFSRYTLIWSAYLSLGICLKEGTMASVNLIYDRLRHKQKLVLYLITRLIMAVFLAVVLIYGIQTVNSKLIFKSATLRIPGIFLFSAPVVGALLMSYEMITELIGVLAGVLKPFEGYASSDDSLS